MSTQSPRNHKDQSAKAILTYLGTALARQLTGLEEPLVESVASSEQQIFPMTPDLILKVTHPQTGAFHLVVEIQVNPDPDLPYRLATLTAHLLQKHRLPVIPVVVYLLAGRGRRPSPLDIRFQGLDFKADFLQVVLPELDARDLLNRGLDGPWWPFAIFARGGREPDNLGRMGEVLRTRSDVAEIAPTVLFLISHVVEREQLRALLEGTMLDPIFKKLEPLEGSLAWEIREAWKAEARAEGEAREALRFVKRMVARKFGMPDPVLTTRLECLTLEKLETLGDALFDISSPAELESWLDAQG